MNKKGMRIWLATSFIYITIFCVIGGTFIYKQSENIFYEKTAQLIAVGANANDDIEQDLVSALKNKNEVDINSGKKILNQYGYIESSNFIFNTNQGFSNVLNVILILIVAIFSYFVVSLVVSNIIKGKRIDSLAKYLYDINEGNYTMQIKSKEDEFSILEDELYKTVMMLRESRENERVEKENLCNNLADISHQLKTPITSMSLMIELLEASNIEGDEALYIGSISAQIERLNYLVSSLLILSKIDADSIQLEYKPINVYELICVAVEPLRRMIEKKKQQLFIKDNSDIFFNGDFHWTSEAILNIVKNCYEHTPDCGLISIDYKQDPLCTQIIIEDNGKGFDKKDIPHLFTRFYKGANSSKNSVGIGLALSMSIIKKQNGEITAVNKETGGAKFIIKFYRN
ncbi:HAMP domain-containing sensor histidine kinase [Paraclostridium bifermentans]|jgi:signal transduction histidine kinase|uniref:sensor histidine kinase n=1 Tax=Paraclostridium bifermentans TaxID=1490 RepID=UPI000DF7A3DF|nr:HAMP domain-containing sensor histidine kinase [Paraclostridium bifermentans]MBS5953189.1 HAMP domain-containing histidine kinase [Paraclostridium bifermentans]MBU5287298.1 HAMP domain-containing histidine kinase [Paraclostridium bifermentans]RDC50707.1 sensor histidine kinase [Acinetobacter sp. RIT592]